MNLTKQIIFFFYKKNYFKKQQNKKLFLLMKLNHKNYSLLFELRKTFVN
jgi:hypothetical protein